MDMIATAAADEQQHALLLLVRKCVDYQERQQMYEANGIHVLSGVVKMGDSYTSQLYALVCLSWATNDESKLSPSIFEALRASIREATSEELVSLVDVLRLGSDEEKDDGLVLCASIATRGQRDELRDVGVMPPLVEMLRNGTASQKLWATEALGTLARGNDANCVAIAREGGIPPLVKLERTGTDVQKLEAASALDNIAKNEASRTAVAQHRALNRHLKAKREKESAAMSNIYITEPNTEGKVLLHTSFGDLDVELWPQQAPKACRNFVQLCLEGVRTVFHRIIAGFMVQGGDPTGTGTGGESVFGGAFIDEFHSRLRFNHRGLLAMANENKPNSNHSQFFFTLDACDFLEKKHTIFGKITGNTIFNLLSVGDMETDAQDRPTHPPKLLSAEVLWNPFEDIVPRAMKRKETTQLTAEEAQRKKKRERKATKDLKLLSFGDEEEAFQEEIDGNAKAKKKKRKMMSSHDLLDDRKLKAEVDVEVLQKITETSREATGDEKKAKARANLKAAVAAASAGSRSTGSDVKVKGDTEVSTDPFGGTTAKKCDKVDAGATGVSSSDKKREREEYAQLREELRQSRKAVPLLMGEEAKKQESARAFQNMLNPLQQQRQKYLQRKKASSRSSREQDTLAKLKKFQATLVDVNSKQQASARDTKPDEDAEKSRPDAAGAEGYHGQVLESDDDAADSDDKSWMTAKLKFKKHIDVRKALHVPLLLAAVCFWFV
ncbi:hypothetical protein BBJ28_00007007 [Nothophytophthora sp. Chile5]|nr:hypothetical protein BBJ28_00007007 [Nothophytophthora sp. Chile5]